MCYEKKRDRTKGRIKEVFGEMFEQNGFQKITVSSICEKSGINRWTFYNYYENVDALLLEIEEALLDEARLKCDLLMRQAYWENTEFGDEMLIRFLLFYKKNKNFMVHFLSESGDPFFLDSMKELLGSSFLKLTAHYGRRGRPGFEKGMDTGRHVKGGWKERRMIGYMASAALKIIHDWLSDDDISVEDVAKLLKKLILA